MLHRTWPRCRNASAGNPHATRARGRKEQANLESPRQAFLTRHGNPSKGVNPQANRELDQAGKAVDIELLGEMIGNATPRVKP